MLCESFIISLMQPLLDCFLHCIYHALYKTMQTEPYLFSENVFEAAIIGTADLLQFTSYIKNTSLHCREQDQVIIADSAIIFLINY